MRLIGPSFNGVASYKQSDGLGDQHDGWHTATLPIIISTAVHITSCGDGDQVRTATLPLRALLEEAMLIFHAKRVLERPRTVTTRPALGAYHVPVWRQQTNMYVLLYAQNVPLNAPLKWYVKMMKLSLIHI